MQLEIHHAENQAQASVRVVLTREGIANAAKKLFRNPRSLTAGTGVLFRFRHSSEEQLCATLTSVVLCARQGAYRK
jgi:hypothetical protein